MAAVRSALKAGDITAPEARALLAAAPPSPAPTWLGRLRRLWTPALSWALGLAGRFRSWCNRSR